MLSAIAILPDSPLLVPGVGRLEGVAEARAAAYSCILGALGVLGWIDADGAMTERGRGGRVAVAADGDRLGPPGARGVSGQPSDTGWGPAATLRVSLAALGVPDATLGVDLAVNAVDGAAIPLAAAAPLHVLRWAGWAGATRVIGQAGPTPWAEAERFVAKLVDGDAPTFLVAAGLAPNEAREDLPFAGLGAWQLSAAAARSCGEAGERLIPVGEMWTGKIGPMTAITAAWRVER